eukprot:56953-Chlamydomonas_euryale.AAC.4
MSAALAACWQFRAAAAAYIKDRSPPAGLPPSRASRPNARDHPLLLMADTLRSGGSKGDRKAHSSMSAGMEQAADSLGGSSCINVDASHVVV